MAEGSQNVKVYLSCADSSYDKRNWTVSNSKEDVHSGSVGKKDSDGSTDALGMAPFLLGTLTIGLSNGAEEVEWRLNSTKRCANLADYLPHLLLLCALRMPNIASWQLKYP